MNWALPAAKGMFLAPAGGIGGRAATNHPQNTWAGIQKLLTSLKAEHWRKGTSAKHDWDDIAAAWATLFEQLPEELCQIAASILKGGRR